MGVFGVVVGQKLFKDGLYGERFLPLLIDKKGKLAIGFEPENSLSISKGEEQWFELLRSFFEQDAIPKKPRVGVGILAANGAHQPQASRA